MQKHAIPQGLEVDHCPSHGVWLDLGELEALVQRAPVTTPAPPAPHTAPPGAGVGAAVKQVGQHFGQSVVMGAGATLGNRIVGGILDAVFRR